MLMAPDSATLKRAQQGDGAAFAEVVDHCYDSIFRFALKYTGHRQDAEDVAQLACIKLAKAIGSFRFESAFTTWLYALVLNCARDWYRQQGYQHFSDQDPEEIPQLSRETSQGESLVYLRQILHQVEAMGEGFRETLVLVAGEGLSHAEAAALLGVKESTVSWRLHEVRKKLASANGREGLQ